MAVEVGRVRCAGHKLRDLSGGERVAAVHSVVRHYRGRSASIEGQEQQAGRDAAHSAVRMQGAADRNAAAGRGTKPELSAEQHGGALDAAELPAAGAIQRRGPVPSGFRRYEGGRAAGEAAQRAEAADAATHEAGRGEVAEAEGGDGDQRGDDCDAEEVLPRGV